MIPAIIVENESPIAEVLLRYLERDHPDIQIVGVYEDVRGTLEGIKMHKPELVFLDVELNRGETAFDILRNLSDIDFKIIFTTAYNQYAVQAIKFSALDYLLKPIDPDELKVAVRRFMEERSVTSPSQHHAILNYRQGDQDAKIGLPVSEGLVFIRVGDILYCQGQSAQSMIYLTSGKKHLISRTLKECEEMLQHFDFCRIHKSYLANLKHIVKYHRGDGGYIIIGENSHLDVSKNYKEDLLSRLRKL